MGVPRLSAPRILAVALLLCPLQPGLAVAKPVKKQKRRPAVEAEPAPEPELSVPIESPPADEPPPESPPDEAPAPEPEEERRVSASEEPRKSPRPAAGLVVRLDPGFVVWALDAARIQSQVGGEAAGVVPTLVQQTPNGFGLLLHLGYNILGHATVGVDFAGTGWDVFNSRRGGAGFLAGSVAWHPMALLDALSLLAHPAWRDVDVSFSFGAGYGVLGEVRAMDGLHFQVGLRAEYFVARSVSLGFGLRVFPLAFGRYVLNWNDNFVMPLPRGSGGAVFMPSLTLGLHAL